MLANINLRARLATRFGIGIGHFVKSHMFGCSPETRIRKLNSIPFGIGNQLKPYAINPNPSPFEIGFGCWKWDLVTTAKVSSSRSSGCTSISLQRFVLSSLFPFLLSR